MKIICIDAEFADNEELLELSAFDGNGVEVYHQYYRPEKIRTWRTDIHHITPEMVRNEPTFDKHRKRVGRMLADAFAVTGFAVDNDLRVLSRSGVEGLDNLRVVDVKDMYWYLKGRLEGMSPFSVPSLLVCANELGLDFEDSEAHSASADTQATVKCFNILANEYAGADALEENMLLKLAQEIEDAKAKFIEESAKGFVRVFRHGDCYKVKFSRVPDSEDRHLVLEVPVNDRYLAEYEVRKMLKKKEVPDKFGLYKLTPKLLDDIKRYKNSYNAEDSAWCKKIIRNLGRLSI